MSLIDEIKEKLKKYPSLSYSETENSITIHVPEREASFDISLYVDSGAYTAYTVAFGNWHGQFDTAEEAGELVAFGLSDQCRVREFSRGSSPYKWVVESLQNGEWVMVQETGLIFFPFWKQKTEKVFQNSIIARVSPGSVLPSEHSTD